MARRSIESLNIFYIIMLWAACSECYRILTVFPFPSLSHHKFISKLVTELAHRGHDVTLVSPYSERNSQHYYKLIVLDGLQDYMQRQMINNEALFDAGNITRLNLVLKMSSAGTMIATGTLKHPKFQDLLHSNKTFDLILLQTFRTEALLGLGYHFQCPMIIVNTYGSAFWTNYLFANPAPFSYLHNIYSLPLIPSSFYARFSNSLLGVIFEAHQKYVHLPRHNAIMKKFFKGVPDLEEIIYRNISIILLNSQQGLLDAKPSNPAMIHVGGLHIEDIKPLPKDLQDFLDNATNGAILFSLGTNLDSKDLPADKRNAIFKSFAKIKQKVLWKFGIEHLEGIPHNVKICKWLPQNDILAHRNLKVFITHGGLNSILETLYHGVPIIGIPIFGDQFYNIDIAVKDGYGIRLDFVDLTEETLTRVLNKITSDPQYYEKAKDKSNILHDQPTKPMNAAIFWTEYVVRHRGATHLHLPAIHLHWIQLYLLDVIFTIAVAFVMQASIIYILIKPLFKKFKRKRKNSN